MKRSTERILTTHTGSLPRPDALVATLYAKERGEVKEGPEFQGQVRQAVNDIVRKQISVGIDVVNDGEQGKVSYATYVKDRLTGFGGEPTAPPPQSLPDFPEYEKRLVEQRPKEYPIMRRACDGPIAYQDEAALHRELEDFKAALQGVSPEDTFLSAASPGVISSFLSNVFYPTREEYVMAVANAMKTEYDAIHKAGFTLQIDCPDLAMVRASQFRNSTDDQFRDAMRFNIEALNHATRDIPPESMRMHICWGNYEGPHNRDIALHEIVDVILTARPNAISLEAANPRHEHEWKVWEDVKLPQDKILIPGVLDSTTNFIEHPELVAERIVRFAKTVGRENVIAGTDCGFSTGAGYIHVHPDITWAKFQSMADGAAIASKELWG